MVECDLTISLSAPKKLFGLVGCTCGADVLPVRPANLYCLEMGRLAVVVAFSSFAVAHARSHASAADASFDPNSIYRVSRGAAPSSGPADAPVTIVDWSDYGCGYCGSAQDTLARLELLYPGLLRWVHRGLPLDADNTIALELARAANAQGRFQPMHAKLYALHGRVDRAHAELIARELGLEMSTLRRDLDQGTHKPAIAADVEAAERLGISGTPMFFINGRPVSGSQPLQVFVDIVEEELARAGKVAATHPRDLYEALVEHGQQAADAPADKSNRRSELDPTATYRIGLGLPGHQFGPDDAPVTIVEWSDFQCPFCARLVPVLARVRAKYGDQIRLVFRHMPLSAHPSAALAAEAAVAAAVQGKFWPFHDQIFGRFGHLTRADLEAFAQAAKLDLVAFRAALDDHRYRDAVIAEAASAAALGVDGTPTMFINGQPVVGARDNAALDAIIDAHLARSGGAVARGIARADLYALAMAGARGEERADPSTIPGHTVGRLALRIDDRGRAVAAACRRRDSARAAKLAETLDGDVRARIFAACAGMGIDLP